MTTRCATRARGWRLSLAGLGILLLPLAFAEPPLPATEAPAAPAAPAPGQEQLLLERLAAGTLAPGFMRLGPDAAPFLARLMPAQKVPAKGALLVIPADGRFIGNDAIIEAYMRNFPSGGWSVMAIQTPLLSPVSASEHYQELRAAAAVRVRAALAYLDQQGSLPVVLAGQGAGAVLARELAGEVAAEVMGIAAVGPWPGALDTSALPLLDLNADRDAGALRLAEGREQAARHTAHPGYRGYVFAGADRDYLGFEDDVARRVRGWADHLPSAVPAAAAP